MATSADKGNKGCKQIDCSSQEIDCSAECPLKLEGVREPLLRGLAAAGVKSLTPVQVATLPHCLSGADVLAKAKTGTGKTLAFLIPTVERLLRSKAQVNSAEGIDPIRGLVISCTRELANQIVVQAEKLLAFVPDFNIECVLGGSSIIPQRERLDPNFIGQCKYGGVVDLLVATPGRVLEHIESTSNFEARLKGVECFVLDEVDQLLDGGFQQNIQNIISKLSTQRQTLCFSATVPERLQLVIGVALREGYVTIDCVGEEEVDTHEAIEQAYIVYKLEESLLALYLSIKSEIEARPDDHKILIFLPTARQTQFCTAVLKEMGLTVLEIHSRRTQSERVSVSETFRTAKSAVLLSSDVSARGVDYPDVTLVLQAGAPTTREQYVQRLGRTGRAGKNGSGLLLLCDFEKHFLQQVKDLPLRNSSVALDGSGDDARALQAAAGRVDDDLATQTYRAWLIMANGVRKMMRWSKQDLVRNANLFASAVLGRVSVPQLQPELVATLGLQGVDGLNISDGAPQERPGSASPRETDPSEKVVMKIHMKELGLALRKDSAAAAEALRALSDEAGLALQADLDAGRPATVAGFVIQPSMVTVRLVKAAMPRSSSLASISSADCDAMPRTGSSLSLCSSDCDTMPRTGSALSLCSIDGDASDTSAPAPGASARQPPTRPPPPDPAVLKAAQGRLTAAGTALSEATRIAKEAGGEGSTCAVAAAAKELASAKADFKALQAAARVK